MNERAQLNVFNMAVIIALVFGLTLITEHVLEYSAYSGFNALETKMEEFTRRLTFSPETAVRVYESYLTDDRLVVRIQNVGSMILTDKIKVYASIRRLDEGVTIAENTVTKNLDLEPGEIADISIPFDTTLEEDVDYMVRMTIDYTGGLEELGDHLYFDRLIIERTHNVDQLPITRTPVRYSKTYNPRYDSEMFKLPSHPFVNISDVYYKAVMGNGTDNWINVSVENVRYYHRPLAVAIYRNGMHRNASGYPKGACGWSQIRFPEYVIADYFRDEGFSVKFVNLYKNPTEFDPTKYSVIVNPYAECFPCSAWDELKSYLDNGGIYIHLAGAPFYYAMGKSSYCDPDMKNTTYYNARSLKIYVIPVSTTYSNLTEYAKVRLSDAAKSIASSINYGSLRPLENGTFDSSIATTSDGTDTYAGGLAVEKIDLNNDGIYGTYIHWGGVLNEDTKDFVLPIVAHIAREEIYTIPNVTVEITPSPGLSVVGNSTIVLGDIYPNHPKYANFTVMPSIIGIKPSFTVTATSNLYRKYKLKNEKDIYDSKGDECSSSSGTCTVDFEKPNFESSDTTAYLSRIDAFLYGYGKGSVKITSYLTNDDGKRYYFAYDERDAASDEVFITKWHSLGNYNWSMWSNHTTAPPNDRWGNSWTSVNYIEDELSSTSSGTWENVYIPIGDGTYAGVSSKTWWDGNNDLWVRKVIYSEGEKTNSIYKRTQFYLASDDGADCWLNGKKIISDYGSAHGASLWNYVVDITLQPGKNVIACRIGNTGGGGQFFYPYILYSGYFVKELDKSDKFGVEKDTYPFSITLSEGDEAVIPRVFYEWTVVDRVIYDSDERTGRTRVEANPDNCTPETNITYPSNGTVLTLSVIRINGTARDPSTVCPSSGIYKIYIWINDSYGWREATWDYWNQRFYYDFRPEHSGVYMVRTKAVDKSYNEEPVTSEYSTVIFTADIDKPVSRITYPSDGAYINTSWSWVNGTALDIGTGLNYVNLSFDRGSTWVTATGTSNWCYNWTIAIDGVYYIQSKATDNAGNEQEPVDEIVVTVDRTEPVSYVEEPSNYTAISECSFKVNGTATDNVAGIDVVQVRVNGSAWMNAYYQKSTSKWYFAYAPASGRYLVEVRAIDKAGNVESSPYSYTIVDFTRTVDITEPDSNIYESLNGTRWTRNGFTVQGNASDDCSGVKNVTLTSNCTFSISNIIYSAPYSTFTDWSIDFDPADTGTVEVCRINSTAYDVQDNAETTPSFIYVTIDDERPSLCIGVDRDPASGRINVNITSSERLRTYPDVVLTEPDGVERVIAVTQTATNFYEGSIEIRKSGWHTINATGVDIAGNRGYGLFSDNFNDGDALDWNDVRGSWSVSSYMYVERDPTDVDAVSYADICSTRNISVEVDFMSDPSGTWQNGFIVFDYVNPTNFKFAGARVSANYWTIGEYNGAWNNRNTTAETINNSEWYHLKVITYGNMAYLYVNGTLKVQYDFSSTGGIGNGDVGLAGENNIAYFDNFVTKKLLLGDVCKPTATTMYPSDEMLLSNISTGTPTNITGITEECGEPASGVSYVNFTLTEYGYSDNWHTLVNHSSDWSEWYEIWYLPKNHQNCYYLRAKAVDKAGNVQDPYDEVSIIVDNDAPECQITDPTSNSFITCGYYYYLIGTTPTSDCASDIDSTYVNISDGSSGEADRLGPTWDAWRYEWELSPSQCGNSYNMSCNATDEAGNEGPRDTVTNVTLCGAVQHNRCWIPGYNPMDGVWYDSTNNTCTVDTCTNIGGGGSADDCTCSTGVTFSAGGYRYYLNNYCFAEGGGIFGGDEQQMCEVNQRIDWSPSPPWGTASVRYMAISIQGKWEGECQTDWSSTCSDSSCDAGSGMDYGYARLYFTDSAGQHLCWNHYFNCSNKATLDSGQVVIWTDSNGGVEGCPNYNSPVSGSITRFDLHLIVVLCVCKGTTGGQQKRVNAYNWVDWVYYNWPPT